MKKTILFIVGSGHSGSTILDMAIGANSKCFSLGEITKIDRAIDNNTYCVCGKRIADCDFWGGVADRFSSGSDKNPFDDDVHFGLSLTYGTGSRLFSRTRKVMEVTGLKASNESWVVNTERLYEAVFNNCGADVLVDSSKNIKRAMILANQIDAYNFRFIHLLRDVRGVAYSYQKPVFRVQLPCDSESRSYPATDILPIEDTSSLWLRENLLISLLLKARIPSGQWKRCRYENLCSAPHEVLQEISSWLGIGYESAMIRFGSVVHHNVGGNPSRFNSNEVLNIRSGWKKNLDQKQQERCTRYASWLMRLYGYDPSPALEDG